MGRSERDIVDWGISEWIDEAQRQSKRAERYRAAWMSARRGRAAILAAFRWERDRSAAWGSNLAEVSAASRVLQALARARRVPTAANRAAAVDCLEKVLDMP